MAEQGLTLAFAESATAGWLCSEFALTEESGKVLLGSAEQLIDQYTPESMEIIREIAYRLKDLIPSDIQVTVTGLTTLGTN